MAAFLTAAEMAKLIDDEHDPETESLEDFVLRRLGSQPLATLEQALKLMMEIDTADIAFEERKK